MNRRFTSWPPWAQWLMTAMVLALFAAIIARCVLDLLQGG